DMISRASVSTGSLRRSALTTSVSLTNPTTSPPASSTGTPPIRPATRVATMAASGVSGATDATRSVIMLRACPFTAATRIPHPGTPSIGDALPGGATWAKQGTRRGRNSVVECQLPKLDVAGSTPVARSLPTAWQIAPFVSCLEAEQDDAQSPRLDIRDVAPLA